MSDSQIKVPYHSKHSKVERALEKVPADGKWHQIAEMAMTSAEQTARAYNVPGAKWELGYSHGTDGNGKIVSFLHARWIG